MLDLLIKWSLNNRIAVVIGGVILIGTGIWSAVSLPVDVFPDLAAPAVTVLTDAHGMGAEDIERLITYPIEAAIIGAAGVRRLTSSSAYGISVIHADFEWGTDLSDARRVIGERVQSLGDVLPPDIHEPIMTPSSSIMGEIMLIGLSSDSLPPTDVRAIADFEVRRKLLGVPGVAQVVPIGGDVKEFHVIVLPERLRQYALSLDEVMDAVSESNRDGSGGIYRASGREIKIRGLGRIRDIEDIASAVVGLRDGVPVLVDDVATVRMGSKPRYGTASINGQPAVVMSIQKQPGANTIELTRRIDEALDELGQALPASLEINRNVFRQSIFIGRAVNNVIEALRDGALLVIIILFLFLWSVRATVISVLAIPISLCAALVVMKLTGATVNTMTLGGMAIAIGALVDDAIIDVENVHRRLRSRTKESALTIVFEASKEVRSPIMNATAIICVVFVPFLFLGGFEGQLLKPLGYAYVISILASLVVAMTITPTLCLLWLPGTNLRVARVSAWAVRWFWPLLEWGLRRRRLVLGSSIGLLLVSLLLLFTLDRGFLPPFQEGSLVVHTQMMPGTSLEVSSGVGVKMEETLRAHPAVLSTSRRTGRGDLDDHLLPVSTSEIDVALDLSDHDFEEVLEELRSGAAALPGVITTFGQPISHRIDHVLSGSRSALVVKIYGQDLALMRQKAAEVGARMGSIQGLADILVEAQAFVPQLRLYANRERMAFYGITAGQLVKYIETAFGGRAVTSVQDGTAVYDVVVRFPEERRSTGEEILRAQVNSGHGTRVELGELVDLSWERGLNTISRENAQRVLSVSASVTGGNTAAAVRELGQQLSSMSWPTGFNYVMEGRVTSANEAAMRLGLFSILALVLIFVILQRALRGAKLALLVMVNLPLALTGGILTLVITGTELNLAAMVGFLTLFGIAVRNGLLLVSQYQNLRAQGLSLDNAVLQGTLERLIPIMMTAITAALALLPLALGGSEQGKEIQSPMAIVILGGLLTSTFLNMFVVPTLYKHYFPAEAVSPEKSLKPR